jgi:hypothetical protein
MPTHMCNKGMVVYGSTEKISREVADGITPDRYSEEHQNMTFAQAQALYRVFCNRTPIDC